MTGGDGGRRAQREGSPTVLAFDSSGGACSAALLRQRQLIGHQFRPMARGHAEVLIPMAIEVIAQGGIEFRDLDLVAVTVGPGAFTGLRIGLAAARGLALAAGLPVLGVTSFAAVAESVPPAERAGRPLAVLLDTKREDLFAQLFDAALAPIGAPAVLSVAALAAWLPDGPLLAAGDGLTLARAVLEGRPDIACARAGQAVDAADVARIAARQFVAGSPASMPVAPFYLRAPAVTLPGPAGTPRGDPQ